MHSLAEKSVWCLTVYSAGITASNSTECHRPPA